MNRNANVLATLATATLLTMSTGAALAADYTISVWANHGASEDYRIEAIRVAADLLEREYAVRGDELNITIEGKSFTQWSEFKQSVTLAAEAGTAPNIVVGGHEDIAPWSQSGLIVAIEDYIDVDSWPISGIFENLLEIASFQGQLWGVPQDAESRPFFFWKDHMMAIGYSEADLAGLAEKVRIGDYTLQNVLEDAKKMQDAGLVEEGMGFWPRPTKGGDFWQFYSSFGGEMEDEQGQLLLDKAAMTAFYQFFVDAVDMGVTRKNHIGTPWDQWHGALTAGKAGMWHGGTWQYNEWTEKYSLDFFEDVIFSLIPGGGENGQANTLTHPLVYVITKQEDETAMGIAAKLISIASEPRINALHAISQPIWVFLRQ